MSGAQSKDVSVSGGRNFPTGIHTCSEGAAGPKNVKNWSGKCVDSRRQSSGVLENLVIIKDKMPSCM